VDIDEQYVCLLLNILLAHTLTQTTIEQARRSRFYLALNVWPFMIPLAAADGLAFRGFHIRGDMHVAER
jgi:hypothetical protein